MAPSSPGMMDLGVVDLGNVNTGIVDLGNVDLGNVNPGIEGEGWGVAVVFERRWGCLWSYSDHLPTHYFPDRARARSRASQCRG